eukprot:2313990-Amphidinium_carterae.1
MNKTATEVAKISMCLSHFLDPAKNVTNRVWDGLWHRKRLSATRWRQGRAPHQLVLQSQLGMPAARAK